MKDSIFKLFLLGLVSLFSVEYAASASEGAEPARDKPAYAVFTAEGERSDYAEMLKTLSKADIVLIGETHNCPVAHWLEYELTRELYQKNGFVIGAEMFETDNQLLVDEYVSGLISSDRFETEAKLWDNYYTDYYPLLSFAREKGIRFIATNVPRRYASYVKEKGLEALEGLSAEAKALMAPLPIAFEASEESDEMFGFMQMMGGKEKSYFAEAQALKDATMAWSIARNFEKKFVHYNGNFHSDSRGGIIPYLENYLPGKSIATVCCIRQDKLKSLEETNIGRADFIVVVPTDFPMSY